MSMIVRKVLGQSLYRVHGKTAIATRVKQVWIDNQCYKTHFRRTVDAAGNEDYQLVIKYPAFGRYLNVVVDGHIGRLVEDWELSDTPKKVTQNKYDKIVLSAV